MNQIEKLEQKIKDYRSLNDEFQLELREVKDILICIGYTDKDTFPEVILNAVDSVSKLLELKIEKFVKDTTRINI